MSAWRHCSMPAVGSCMTTLCAAAGPRLGISTHTPRADEIFGTRNVFPRRVGTCLNCEEPRDQGSLSGVGKPQLAAAYAHRAWVGRAVDLLVWVAATTRQAIIAAYAVTSIPTMKWLHVMGPKDPDQPMDGRLRQTG